MKITTKEDIKNILDIKPRTLILEEVSWEFFGFFEVLPMFIKEVYLKFESGTIDKLLRVQMPIVDGIKYRRPKHYFTIDITTACNLSCNNCQRASHIPMYNQTMSHREVMEAVEHLRYKGSEVMIKLLGGEPTVHPDINRIIEDLQRYFHVGIVTNGATKWTPPNSELWVEDTGKDKFTNPEFYTTFDAPIDNPDYNDVDYSLGCATADHCGNCRTKQGFYPCNVGGTIDRLLFNSENARKELWEVEDASNREEFFSKMCKYCGVFKYTGYSTKPRPPLTTEEVHSETFKFLGE